MSEKVIVIGGTAAGLSAASRFRKLSPEAEIVVYERSGYISYGSCGLPYFVGGMIGDPEDLVSLSMEEAERRRGIRVRIRHEVLSIDRAARTVAVRDLATGNAYTDTYDKLILATGASPVRLPVPGGDAENIRYLRTVEDGIGLKAELAEKGRRIAVIGGGFIGLETAEEMTAAGARVTLIEALPRLLPMLPEAWSEDVADALRENGVSLFTGSGVSSFDSYRGRAAALSLSGGQRIETDAVLCCVGVLPNSGLASGCGLELGVRNAIRTDREMRTSDPAIWACGDCAETYNALTGQPDYIPLGTTANKQGRVAGASAAGQRTRFAGVVGSAVTKVFDRYIAMTGLSPDAARKAGFDAADVEITHRDKASYYPGARPFRLRLVFERKTGRLLGAQALGGESAAGRIDTLAACVTAGMTVFGVNDLDLVYAPPVAPVYDPILIAAQQAIKYV